MSFSRELGVVLESKYEVAKLDQIFNQKWDTSINAEIPWYLSILPTPAPSMAGRILRTLFPPVLLVDALENQGLRGGRNYFQHLRPLPKEAKSQNLEFNSLPLQFV